MAYKVSHHNAFAKGLKTLDRANKDKVLNHCDAIQANPYIGESTQGNLKKLDIRKYSITDTNPQYRVLYKIYKCSKKSNKYPWLCENEVNHESEKILSECEGYVDYLICGPREMFNNFYRLPLDKLKKYI